ncbi:DUF1168-domain-containing protein [Trametes coccinea BRFM310]|uniref:DUF1168-domain-containing protein n=1 Tax=Trametes coccinea (strain BRFM310) TaxID=1353009 RepID=A0A1Y2J3P9_TRAC3|nr:DUF1168-domain-containing protein [Trametes coccinea BRFM310]
MSASPAHSPSPGPSGANQRHASTPLDKQRAQLEKLLKDPAKPAYIPPPPKEKSIRPPREMMKNVQGSSAGAGSGEFHVYKASRRREYERLKMMEEQAQKEAIEAEFERRKREREEQAEAKTAKNRAKRQKKKERAKGKAGDHKQQDGAGAGSEASGDRADVPLKKRRLVSGRELVFRRPGEEDSDEEDDDEVGPMPQETNESTNAPSTSDAPPVPVVDAPRITIIEED